MKHFFPLLTIAFILCVLSGIFPVISVYAQQQHSFASAQDLPVNQTISMTIPANASEYYYFHSLQSTGQTYQIKLSKAKALLVSLYNDQGTYLNPDRSISNASAWTGFYKIGSANGRFFLVLHNQSTQDIVTQISIKTDRPTPTASPKSVDRKHRKTPSPKPTGRKHKKTVSPRPADHNYKKTPSPSPSPKNRQTPIPQQPGRKGSPAPSPPSDTSSAVKQQHPERNTATPKTTPNKQHMQTPGRSDFILSTHFFRMNTGYSISLPALIQAKDSDNTIRYENVTPDLVSLQNNILYTKNSGIAVIRILTGTSTTSCTIYIQDEKK